MNIEQRKGRLIQYAKGAKFSQMLEFLNTQRLQKSQQYKVNPNHQVTTLDEQLKTNMLNLIMQSHFFKPISSLQEQSQQIISELRQNADYLLQLAPFFMFSEFSTQQTCDLLFLQSVLMKHKQLNQLKYALALFREQISTMKMSSSYGQITIFRFLSTFWIFVDLIAQGKKIMVDVLHMISQFFQLQNSIQKKLFEQDNYANNQQDSLNNKKTFVFLAEVRNKITQKCIETLLNAQLTKIQDQNLVLYQKIHIIDLFSYILTPSLRDIKNKNSEIKMQSNIDSLKYILLRYNISLKDLSGSLIYLFIDQLELFYSKRFIFSKLVNLLLTHIPSCPNQFNYENPLFMTAKKSLHRQGLKITYNAPPILLQKINQVIEYLCKKYLNDLNFLSEPNSFTIDLIIKNEQKQQTKISFVQLIKRLSVHLGAGVAPKSSTHKTLLNAINNLTGINYLKKQVIWRMIIQQINKQKTQFSQSQYNFKSFCVSQYRKMLIPKYNKSDSEAQKRNVFLNISFLIKQQVIKLKDKHGDLNYLAHVLTMIFHWKKTIEPMLEKGTKKVSISQFSWMIDLYQSLAFVSQICLKLKEELRIRHQASKNDQQRSSLLICIFRISELGFDD